MVGRRRRRRREDGDCTESLYSLYNPGMVGGGGWWRIILDSQLHQHIPTLRYSQILKYPPYNRKITVCNLNLIFQRLWNKCSIFTIVDLFDRYQKLCNPHPEIPPTWLTLSGVKPSQPSVSSFRLQRMARKEGFYRVELIKTVWEVPERYQNLMPVGHGAFGQVEYRGLTRGLSLTHCRFVLPPTPSGDHQMAPRYQHWRHIVSTIRLWL